MTTGLEFFDKVVKPFGDRIDNEGTSTTPSAALVPVNYQAGDIVMWANHGHTAIVRSGGMCVTNLVIESKDGSEAVMERHGCVRRR